MCASGYFVERHLHIDDIEYYHSKKQTNNSGAPNETKALAGVCSREKRMVVAFIFVPAIVKEKKKNSLPLPFTMRRFGCTAFGLTAAGGFDVCVVPQPRTMARGCLLAA